MDAWTLPVSLKIGGREYRIRTDYRVILDILMAMSDPDIFEPGMSEKEKNYERCMTILQILFEDFESIPAPFYQEALEKACDFIDCGIKDGGKKKPTLMNWQQDAPVMIPAVNKVIGKDVRAMKYMHWWTFLGAYMEIGEGIFSQIVSIRNKKAKRKKLEKWEQEFYQNNKHLVDLNMRMAERSEEEKEELRELFGIKKK